MHDIATTRALLQRQPAPPDLALLAALALASRRLWATQTSPRRADGSALAQLHLALAQDELAALGAPPDLSHDDPLEEQHLAGLLEDLAAALRRGHSATGASALLVAAHHVTAALSALAGATAPT